MVLGVLGALPWVRRAQSVNFVGAEAGLIQKMETHLKIVKIANFVQEQDSRIKKETMVLC